MTTTWPRLSAAPVRSCPRICRAQLLHMCTLWQSCMCPGPRASANPQPSSWMDSRDFPPPQAHPTTPRAHLPPLLPSTSGRRHAPTNPPTPVPHLPPQFFQCLRTEACPHQPSCLCPSPILAPSTRGQRCVPTNPPTTVGACPPNIARVPCDAKTPSLHGPCTHARLTRHGVSTGPSCRTSWWPASTLWRLVPQPRRSASPSTAGALA